jgi:predicted nucleic acid-binding protein
MHVLCRYLVVNGGLEPVHGKWGKINNLVEDAAGIGFTCDLLAAVMAKPLIDVRSVSADEYRESVQQAQKYSVSINNTFALIVMEQQGIDEISTFYRHFERAAVRCVQE